MMIRNHTTVMLSNPTHTHTQGILIHPRTHAVKKQSSHKKELEGNNQEI